MDLAPCFTFCVLIFLTIFSVVYNIRVSEFYPFGTEHGDSSLPPSYESSSPPITFETPIKFYNDEYSTVYVSTNGLISFIQPLPHFISVPFPLDYPVIAPLYTNVDTRRTGSVYYRKTNESELITRATYDVWRAFPKIRSNFRASNLFIATWFKVGYYNNGFNKVNTYQAVIITDGTETYVQFSYADDGIQWLQGHGQTGTGLPDAKAQAGLVSSDGSVYLLKGSGSDQIRNLVRWSNTDAAGVWMFRVGLVTGNVEVPEISSISQQQQDPRFSIKTCTDSFTLCHSDAECHDTSNGYCCKCKRGYFGNGYNCLKEGIPLRANGKVTMDINNIKVNQLDLQAYVVVADGRSYTAISKIPWSFGYESQLLYPLTAVLGWLFAKPIGDGQNGYQLTGGVLNYTGELTYKETGHKVTIRQRYFGLDVFDQLKISMNIHGSIPKVKGDVKIIVSDYQQQFTRTAPGIFRSSSTLSYKIGEDGQEQNLHLEQTIVYDEPCTSENSSATTYRVRTARSFNTYEVRENILRIAATSKVSVLSGTEDPCIEGRVKCVVNSSCIVEEDAFRCVCNPGFQTTAPTNSIINNVGCFDINECSERLHYCDQNAICINEIGTYTCMCKPGYIGNGYYCSEIESPCKRDPSLCDQPGSYCKIPGDHRTCDCKPGYHKYYLDSEEVLFRCRDIDECSTTAASQLCEENSSCVNTEGGFRCECNSRYEWNGYNCTLQRARVIDCTSKQCGVNQVCEQRDPHEDAICICSPFHIWENGQCTAIQPSTENATSLSCEVARNCHLNAECLLNETTREYSCRCIPGYKGDGYDCQIIQTRLKVSKICMLGSCWCPPNYIELEDACEEIDPSHRVQQRPDVSCKRFSYCHQNAQCVYDTTNARYKCECNAGYEGDGTECVEAEISCQRVNNCDAHATCQVEDGSTHATCVCNRGYHGDGLHCIYAGVCTSDGDCGNQEECIYNEPTQSYECRCLTGYQKSEDGSCQPEKRCPICHINAACVIEPTTKDLHCVCISGYTGDGTINCDPVPPSCNVLNNCSPFAECVAIGNTEYSCRCRRGYEGNGTYCYNVKKCDELPELCHVNASCVTREHREPACECAHGFVGNGSYCSEIPRQEGDFLIVNQGISILRMPNKKASRTPGYPIVYQESQSAVGIAIDCVDGRVYWSDVQGRSIKSSTYKGKDIRVLFNFTAYSSPEGLTIDWINRVLYWTDSGKDTIESINLDGTDQKVILSTGLVNPRGIAVHPYKRKLFWSDWNRESPKIEWSNLDGSERSVFSQGNYIQLPNALTVDWGTNEICYADAGINTKAIGCIGIDNKSPRVAVSNCSYPFGLTSTSEAYYWTDWKSGTVETMDKVEGKTEKLVIPPTGSGRLYGIVAVPTHCY